MNIDLTRQDLVLLIDLLEHEDALKNLDNATDLKRRLSRYLQPEGHSPETETKEGIVDTSKNKDWKAP